MERARTEWGLDAVNSSRDASPTRNVSGAGEVDAEGRVWILNSSAAVPRVLSSLSPHHVGVVHSDARIRGQREDSSKKPTSQLCRCIEEICNAKHAQGVRERRRTHMPVSLPLSSGITTPTALAAPVPEGMMLNPAPLPIITPQNNPDGKMNQHGPSAPEDQRKATADMGGGGKIALVVGHRETATHTTKAASRSRYLPQKLKGYFVSWQEIENSPNNISKGRLMLSHVDTRRMYRHGGGEK